MCLVGFAAFDAGVVACWICLRIGCVCGCGGLLVAIAWLLCLV